MAIDFASINEAATAQGRRLLETWLPGGEWKNGEYWPRNPTRADKKAGSFSIHPATGKFVDFASGDKGGDWVALYAYLYRLNQGEAAKEVAVHLGLQSGHVQARSVPALVESKPEPVDPASIPIPPENNEPCPRHILESQGVPARVFQYNTPDGGLLGYVLRYDKPDGGKDVKPLFYFKGKGWQFRGFRGDVARPIYGADRLAANPTKPVIVVEGEKAADAGQALLPEYVVISWLGGTSTAGRTDWAALKNRTVMIWPDNDEPGQKAAKVIHKALPHARIIKIPAGLKQGWDLADAESLDLVMEILDPKPVTPTIVDERIDDGLIDNGYFRCLGQGFKAGSTRYYFYNKRSGLVVSYGCSMKFEHFQELAPVEFWEITIPFMDSRSKLIEAARDLLFAICTRLGNFDEDSIRGVGTWIDEGRTVVNMGDRLSVDGEIMAYPSIKSRYVYLQSSVKLRAGQAITAAQGEDFLGLCCSLNWVKPIDGWLLAGWVFLAPVCGGLRWRPHVWVTGPHGSGKSWVMSHIVQEVLADFSVMVLGESTEAGIRQYLGTNAIPVIFDEAESEEESDNRRMKSIMALVRQASSAGGGQIMKGTTGGHAQRFNIRSMFAFSSIINSVKQNSDKSRVSTLTLAVNPDTDKGREAFEYLKATRKAVLKPDFISGLKMRAIEKLPKIREAVKVFSDAASLMVENKRLGDQLGTLMAGAWMLYNDEIPTLDEAKALIESNDWQEEKDEERDADPRAAVVHLMQASTQVVASNAGRVDITIGELVYATQENQFAYGGISGTQIETELARRGLLVKDGYLIIQNTNTHLKQIYKDTPWAGGWNKALRFIKDAKRTGVVYYGRQFGTHRGVAVPLGAVGLGVYGGG